MSCISRVGMNSDSWWTVTQIAFHQTSRAFCASVYTCCVTTICCQSFSHFGSVVLSNSDCVFFLVQDMCFNIMSNRFCQKLFSHFNFFKRSMDLFVKSSASWHMFSSSPTTFISTCPKTISCFGTFSVSSSEWSCFSATPALMVLKCSVRSNSWPAWSLCVF